MLVFTDGTVAGRDARHSPVIAMYSTDDAASLARHLQSSEAGIAQLLKARRAVALVGVPQFGAAPDLPAITSLLAPARAAAASSWLRSAPDPCGSVVALGARLAVASASAAPPAVMTSAWAPSAGFRQVVDDLAWAVVEQAVTRAGQSG